LVTNKKSSVQIGKFQFYIKSGYLILNLKMLENQKSSFHYIYVWMKGH